MNSFLLSNNPPAAVWKTALRILGIAMLSFLFISEGWGQGDLTVDAKLMADNVFLTHRAKTEGGTDYAWFYKVGENGTEKEFSGRLTTGSATAKKPFPSDFFFTITNDVNTTPTPELTLHNFHYSGRNGVFLLNGAQLVKITAENACTLENTGTTVLNEEKRSVIHIRRGSMLELNGGTEGMTIQNTQAQGNIQGLYNNYNATTILSGKIDFFAKDGNNEKEVYAIKNNGTLRATAGAEIRAMGKSIHPTGSHTSPFMCWDFSIPPPINSVISIKKVTGGQEGDEVASFEGDGESTNFLIPGEANTSYTVYVQGEKQMGRKQDLNNLGNLGSYTYTFDATTDGSETNEKQLSIYRSVIAPSQLTLKLSSVTDKLTLHYKEKDDSNYAWFYKIGDSDPETEFSGTLEGTKEGWTHGAISIISDKDIPFIDLPKYPPVTLKKVKLTSTASPLIDINGSKPVYIQVEGKSTLEGDGNVINITDSPIILDGGADGLEIIGTGQASHGIHLTDANSKAILLRNVTVDAAVPIYIADEAQLSVNTYATVLLSSSSGEAISLGGTTPGSVGTPFLEWRFDDAPAAGGNLQVKNGNGNTLINTFPTDGNNKTFATNVTAGTDYTLWLNDTKQQKGKLSGGSTSDYTELFQVSTTGEKHVVYTDIALYRQIASSPEGLKDIIDNVPANETNPTKILLTEDIDLRSVDFQLETNDKYIEIDGGEHTIIPHYGYENFNFPEGGGNSSLTLTNITLDCTNTSSRSTYAFINVKNPNVTITLGKGFKMENGERRHEEDEIIKVYGVDMQAGTLIMKEGAVIEGNTDKKGAAIGITSDATLRLEGGKIQNCNGSTGLYLLRKEGATENPKVIIEQFPADSRFDGICLAGYIDAHNTISDDVVIRASSTYSITEDDVSKLGVKAVLQSNGTPADIYELYLDTDNTIKLQRYPLEVENVSFGIAEEGYSQLNACFITIENRSDSPLTIDNVTLADDGNTKFTIISPSNTETVPAGGTNTNYAVQPKDGLPFGTYDAVIQVTVEGHTGIYKGIVNFEVTPGPDDPDPLPEYVYYQVVLPQVTGATTDPVAGTYLVGEGDAFRFNLTLDDDYNLSVPVVQAGDKVLQPDAYGYYLIPNVWHDQTISITGIALNPVDPPSANADLDEPVKVWAEGHTLYIYTASRETIRLYTFSGQLLRQIDNTGRIAIPDLPEGNYLIRIGGRSWKVAL